MSYPAEIAFKRDTTLPPTARRVYDYLTTVLDFREARRVKTQIECAMIGTDRETFSHALTALVASGYLVEYPRDVRGVRVFTLAWSLALPDRQMSANPDTCVSDITALGRNVG